MATIINLISFRQKIGSQIVELRNFWNLSQKDLAEAAGISPSNLCRIEQGRYSVGVDILCRILSVLHAHITISTDDLPF